LERLIDKIKPQRGGEPKAAEPTGDQGADSLALAVQIVGAHLDQNRWKRALSEIRAALQRHGLADLCGGRNREALIRMTRENAGFRMGLTGCALNAGDYRVVVDWLSLGDAEYNQWLAQGWTQAAREVKEPHRSASLETLAGIAHFTAGDWGRAWESWIRALRRAPELFPKITGFIKRSGRLDTRRFDHRLRLIQLIAASGRKQESLSLLQALGMEKRENAGRIVTHFSDILDDLALEPEAAELRLLLAIHVGDPALLKKTVSDLAALKKNDLFQYRRMISQKIEDRGLRRALLMELVRIYVDRMSWENAGLLLEHLYEEAAEDEVVQMMTRVLDHYPILSRLHFLVGRHSLSVGDKPRALRSFGVIREIPEWRRPIAAALEDHLAREDDSDLAEMLLNLLPPKSHLACAVALHLAITRGVESESYFKKWRLAKYGAREQPSPFWRLTMLRQARDREDIEACCDCLGRLISHCPQLSAEAVGVAEWLAENFDMPYVDLIKRIEIQADALVPRELWQRLRQRFAEATERYSKKEGGGRVYRPPAPEPAAELEKSSPDLEAALHKIRALMTADDVAETMKAAKEALIQFPGKTNQILNPIEAKAKRAMPQTGWTLGFIDLLIRCEEFGKAIKLGQFALSNPQFQPELHVLYQSLAQAFEGIGHRAEALRFYCLSSRQSRFYEQNKARLLEMTLPDHPHLLEEALNLMQINEDQEAWHEMMVTWRQHFPDEIDKLALRQESFTNQVETPRSILDLAFWQLQAGELDKVHETLGRIDLRDTEIRDSLVNIANLINLKRPDDPKPKFLLGKFYLLHREVPKAVDTFRNLAKQAPSTAEPIYLYLRNYIKSNPETLDSIYLYGLMIRFSLTFGPAITAIKLLDEFGEKNREGAESLVDGVYRVASQKDDKAEALYAFEALLFKWGAYEKLLHVENEGLLEVHMAPQRLKWIAAVAESAPELRDWALLCRARLLRATQEFQACREALAAIRDEAYRREAQTLYERLTERFPKDAGLWLEAGFAAYPQNRDKARAYFRQAFEKGEPETRVAAFAGLAELGEAPDEGPVIGAVGEAVYYPGLAKAYRHFREAELSHWINGGGDPPVAALEWLIATGQRERYRELQDRLSELEHEVRARLEAQDLGAQGALTQSAWRLFAADVPPARKQSRFYDAGLIERAILAQPRDARLAKCFRDAFVAAYRRPRVIQARVSHLRELARQNRLKAERRVASAAASKEKAETTSPTEHSP